MTLASPRTWAGTAARLVLMLLALSASAGGYERAAQAAELVMFDDPGCVWCRRWHAEIGPGYPHTAEGKIAPLRRVHIRDQATAGVALQSRVTGTPTFVLADNGRELGRIVGYPGADFFYGLLGDLIRKLPQDRPAQPRKPDQAGGGASRPMVAQPTWSCGTPRRATAAASTGATAAQPRGARRA